MSRGSCTLALLVTLGTFACARPATTAPVAQVVIPPSAPAQPTLPDAPPSKPAPSRPRQMPIKGTSLSFMPPAGWEVWVRSGVTAAEVSRTGPAMALMGIALPDGTPADDAAAKDATLAVLAEHLGLSAPRRPIAWRKPDDTRVVGGMRLALWSPSELQRGSVKGPVLVVVAPTDDGHGVMGLAFVPDDDRTGADTTILGSIESFTKTP